MLDRGDNFCFCYIDSHPGGNCKIVYTGKAIYEVIEGVRGERQVVGRGAYPDLLFQKSRDKGIVNKNKEQGRKRASLFHASLNRNLFARRKVGNGSGIGEKVLNRRDKPRGEALLVKDSEYKAVMDRIKGFLVVREQDIPLFLLSPTAIELFIEREKVISHLATR
jgi:hypothetical protein